MKWMLGSLIGSVLGGIVVVRIAEAILGGLSIGVLSIVRPILFVGTTTAITTQSGMSKFNARIRSLRRITTAVEDRISSIVDTKPKR
ncbi:MAG: hypothetical protein O2854_09140 [Chloroflexi bacterium]|nr:hypothetical protein [Chloroflexota bacterium]